ncbi:MAG: conjugal transfer protein TraV, partial [Pseudomonadota bacterium]
MRLTPAITCAVLAAGLGGCTTFGTNVNGSFRCDAPDGVCAPSTVIDDNALAR